MNVFKKELEIQNIEKECKMASSFESALHAVAKIIPFSGYIEQFYMLNNQQKIEFQKEYEEHLERYKNYNSRSGFFAYYNIVDKYRDLHLINLTQNKINEIKYNIFKKMYYKILLSSYKKNIKKI